MATATVVKRISKDGKRKTLGKWYDIVLCTESEENFSNSDGFTNATVRSIDNCGYCDEFFSDERLSRCERCILYKNKICSYDYDNTTLFWQFIDEMLKHISGKSVDRQKAIDLSQRIRNFIKNDPVEGE